MCCIEGNLSAERPSFWLSGRRGWVIQTSFEGQRGRSFDLDFHTIGVVLVVLPGEPLVRVARAFLVGELFATVLLAVVAAGKSFERHRRT